LWVVAREARWKDRPEEHDYPAAGAYLSLLMPPTEVDAVIAALRAAPREQRKAKDVLRASGLPALPADNRHVSKDLERIARGDPLSPVLLVRGDVTHGQSLLIADGYHRVCACYHLDEDADVPCHLA
jgi:hypothetical protein